MQKEEYKKLVKKHTPKEDRFKNALSAFIYGGLLGVLAEAITQAIRSIFNISINDATIWMIIIFIFVACLLTALGIFDKLVTFLKSALIVPITGFAHSVTSAALDYKQDGLITGIGSNCFKLAGSVILYGVISSFILVIIGVLIWLV